MYEPRSFQQTSLLIKILVAWWYRVKLLSGSLETHTER